MNLAVLFLALIPLTWAYAILRYRLMDVDIIFQQGYVYLLATIAVLGVVSILVIRTGAARGVESDRGDPAGGCGGLRVRAAARLESNRISTVTCSTKIAGITAGH